MESDCTRLDFLKQVSDNDIIDIMCNYFDQNMAMYNLIHDQLNNLSVQKNIDHDNNIISFDITINSIDIDTLVNHLRNQYVNCYGRVFNISLNRTTTNGLNISFREEAVV